MSTRSNIGYKHPVTGKYHYVYAHWDGYISHHGRILRDHYKTLQKVKMLVNLGAISILNKNVRPPKKPIWRDFGLFNGPTLKPVEKHTFETPDVNTVVAYHRDRNEPWNDVKPTVSAEFPVEQEWAYCFIDGRWHFKTGRMKEWHLVPDGDLAAFEKRLNRDEG